MPSTRALIHAPWSASKVATALRCPRLFHYKYVEKMPEPEVNPEAKIGKALHKAFEYALHGRPVPVAIAEARADLAEENHSRYDALTGSIAPFVLRIQQFRRRKRVNRQLVEYSLAIRDDGTATQFYSGDAYYRGILDVGYLFEDNSFALVDHKSGVRFGANSTIGDQLDGYAVLAYATFRQVESFWLGVHWIADRALEWNKPASAEMVQERFTSQLFDNVEAAALAVDDGPRTNPGAHCHRCAYRSVCPASREQTYHWLEYEDDDE